MKIEFSQKGKLGKFSTVSEKCAGMGKNLKQGKCITAFGGMDAPGHESNFYLTPHYFHQSCFHSNKERVSSNVSVGLVSFWVSFVIIKRFRYSAKNAFISPVSS